MRLFLEEEKRNDVDGEQEYNDDFQPKHALIIEVALDDAVELVELSEAFFHAAAPLVEVESFARAQVNAGQIPVAEKLGDVRHLVIQLRDIDPEPAKSLERG